MSYLDGPTGTTVFKGEDGTVPIPSQMNFAALDGDYGLRVIS